MKATWLRRIGWFFGAAALAAAVAGCASSGDRSHSSGNGGATSLSYDFG